ncbi:unnamed protein product [Triticum turgidum subsp. durum]|uniref:F-box domain-containing protein n=1 Tax=Triticum turgidum subsp. durum TaxID=4567 RepID=A0A9R0WFW3_TRITD|nr:unnamed protein product [Triticum turgidum subsp. durum]
MASGVDSISALPDDVLHSVLRLLPAEEVVRTCVLARRWRGVWRSMPSLRFNGAEGWGSADRFAQFVDHLLHLRFGGDGGARPPLDSCEFDFDADGFMQLPANERHASHWIWQAVPHVRVLRLHVVEFEQEPSPLSDLRLVSQHLTRLDLVGLSEATDLELSADSDVGPSYVSETQGIYKPLGQSVAFHCLKIVEIKCANVDSKVHRLLKILTTYGIRLEQIRVKQTSRISGSECELLLTPRIQ